VGDQLVSSQGLLVPIESISNLNEITTVYNLRVADHHTYFVGGALWGWDVWVHNASYSSLKGAKFAQRGKAYAAEAKSLYALANNKTKSLTIAVTEISNGKSLQKVIAVNGGAHPDAIASIEKHASSIGARFIVGKGRTHAEIALLDELGSQNVRVLGVSHYDGPCFEICRPELARRNFKNVWWETEYFPSLYKP
jgi:hypothetical protein